MTDGDLAAAARAWRDEDPDPSTRAEVDALLAAGDAAGLADRFGARLAFGTAGIRGPLGAGPNRMNRAVVRRVAAGLARHLLDAVPAAAEAGVVVGRDARRGSEAFATDAAAVLAGHGLRTRVLPGPLPTPLLAFAVRHLGCAAGIMVTASHNPPSDNGVKVYWADGGQIVPPVDASIAAAAEAAGPPGALPLGEPEVLGPEVVEAYLDGAADLAVLPRGGRPPLRIVATPLHGVGGRPLAALLVRAGFAPPHLVAAQAEPDPDFPTVPFPNPEEPGALDLALADATRLGADLVLANDPDADRLAAAVPAPGGGWRVLTGDEVGVLLAWHLLTHGPASPGRLVATTVVSSTLLAKVAADLGAAYAETLTGFKWIARAADTRPGATLVLGYEEALGYCVDGLVRDKDGLTAALCVAELAAWAASEGTSLPGLLDDLARRHGLHATGARFVRLEGPGAPERLGAAMARLRAAPPAEVGGRAVVAVEDLGSGRPPDLPPADLLVLRLAGGARVALRPSGTEPKLKAYLEVVEPAGKAAGGVEAARRRAGEALRDLGGAVAALLEA